MVKINESKASHLKNHDFDFFLAANGVTQASQRVQGITNYEEWETSIIMGL